MPFKLSKLYAIVLVLIASMFVAQTSQAQSITLGGDDEQIYRLLRANGYTNARITKRDLTIIRTEACKGGDKFLVKVSILNRITSVQKIGTCPVEDAPKRFTRNAAKEFLQSRGYEQIESRRAGSRIISTACLDDTQYEISFNQRGRVTGRTSLGRCPPAGLTPDQIVATLRDQGYRRIVVTDAEQVRLPSAPIAPKETTTPTVR